MQDSSEKIEFGPNATKSQTFLLFGNVLDAGGPVLCTRGRSTAYLYNMVSRASVIRLDGEHRFRRPTSIGPKRPRGVRPGSQGGFSSFLSKTKSIPVFTGCDLDGSRISCIVEAIAGFGRPTSGVSTRPETQNP